MSLSSYPAPQGHAAPDTDGPRQTWGRNAAVIGGSLAAALVAGLAGLLWVRHGVAVFMDTLAAGFAMCF